MMKKNLLSTVITLTCLSFSSTSLGQAVNCNSTNGVCTITDSNYTTYANGVAGYDESSNAAKGGKVTVQGTGTGFITGVAGGDSDTGDATNNSVIISGGTIKDDVTGGSSDSGNASQNTVIISGSVIEGYVAGGNSYSGSATKNSVEISGGKLNSVAGGVSGKTATHNNITIRKGKNGNPTFGQDAILYGGYDLNTPPTAGDFKTGNTLNMHTTGITVKNIANFEKLHFYVQKDTPANATFLTLTDTADTDITATNIGVGLEGRDSLLTKGDQVTLIKKNSGTLQTDTTLTNNVSGMSGISTLYDFALQADSQTLTATVTKVGINPQTKSLSEARLAGINFVNRGADLVANAGMDNLSKNSQAGGINGFAAIGGSASNTDTGSHIKVKGTSLVLGAGSGLANTAGRLTLGGFVELGKGSYDSFNDFTNRPDVHANGKTHYYGLGLIAKQSFSNGWFVDGGLRAGKSKMDYNSTDLVDATGNATHFSGKSNYIGTHIGIGKKIDINETNQLIPYAKIFWLRNGKLRRTIAGDTFDFNQINSLRSQLGARFIHTISQNSQAYADIAWEREYQGTGRAQVLGLSVPEPSLRGNTGTIGVGMQFAPHENISLDLGVSGSFGKRRGLSGSAKIKYSF